ncbi:CPBP family intramembrane metalloprotease [Microbacterium sp. H37-C3]|uniref:CPBP family intramembrane glutamic endopeptidase n=1 Tax=Microbacterium sp. H37-C3 TaxID=3004354 RepID=UPI0022AECDB9|nr:CPBP family intramembrane glutamic endopeptidase [Microbacterium sp. H37-C3]MCZ4069187.1 CPBP family intramembrane metalloprotease [Microbacterium sp. H37-C3]
MHTHPSEPVATTSRRPRHRRVDWRQGGSSVRRWREMMLAWALVSLGAGILLGYLVLWLQPAASWSGLAATAALWLGMLIPVVLALRVSRPAGLLRFRAADLLIGLGFGIVLRLVQGLIQQGVEGQARFPGLLLVDGRLPASWWLTDAAAAGLVAPVLEEFFFRGVVLVAVYTLLRRAAGPATAGVAALLVSTAVFLVSHLVGGALGVDGVLSIALVGVVCAGLVLLTGRIWTGVVAHVVFNLSGVGLAFVGAFTG